MRKKLTIPIRKTTRTICIPVLGCAIIAVVVWYFGSRSIVMIEPEGGKTEIRGKEVRIVRKVPPKEHSSFIDNSEVAQSEDIFNIEARILDRPFSEWAGSLEKFVKLDASLCASVVNSLSDRNDRLRGLQTISNYWARSDFDAAEAWMIQNLPEEQYMALRQHLVAGLILADPERAKEVVLATKAPFIKQQLALSLVHALFTDDPANAENWAIQNLSPIQASQALEIIGRELARGGDMNEAIRVSNEMAFGSSRNNLLSFIGAEYARKDLDSALAWYSSLEADERSAVQPYLMGTWAESDPTEAAEHAFTNATNVDELGNVIGTWAASSPRDSLEWIDEKYDEGTEVKDLIGRVMQRWGGSDPAAAAAYAAGLQPGKERGYYFSLITSNWVARNPAAAGEFLHSIDETDSVSAVRLLVAGWSSLDSMNASKWASSLEQGPKYDAAASV